MVSPSATSPALTDDRGRRLLLPHRAVRRPPGRDPRRHRQGEGHRQRRDHLHQQRLRQGLRRQLRRRLPGGSAARWRSTRAHEDGKADYSAEVAALQASGAPALVVLGYVDQGGVGIVQASLDTGAFEQFFFGDGMYGQSLIDSIGDEINGKVIGTLPGVEGEAADKFAALAQGRRHGPDRHLRAGELRRRGADRALHRRRRRPPTAPASATSCSTWPTPPASRSSRGELAKGLELAAAGTDIDYVGAHRRRADRPGRGAGLLPGLRDQGQRRQDPRLPLIATRRGRPAGPAAATGGRRMIRVEDLHMHFGGIRAVDGASIEIADGSITGLIGPNGAGKSTLFNVIAGLFAADLGPGLARRRGDHRPQPARAVPQGAAAHLPDRPRVLDADACART